MGPSRFSRKELREQKPHTADLLTETPMGGRLNQIDPGTQHGDRISARSQGTPVGSAVDAKRQTTHYGNPP